VTLDEALDVGEDTGTPVTTSYAVPFRFEGDVDRVVIDLE
jgi:arylsulfatase